MEWYHVFALSLVIGSIAIIIVIGLVQEITERRFRKQWRRELRHRQALATIARFEKEEYARSIQLRPRTTIETSSGIWACWVCGRRVSPGFPCGAEHEAIDEAIAEGL